MTREDELAYEDQQDLVEVGKDTSAMEVQDGTEEQW
jgi:hypothetical protein